MNHIGFGFLRLPQRQGSDEVDLSVLSEMVDLFLERGGRYFDTAYTYLKGKSETALREALVKRHPRKKFVVADKLPSWKVSSPADCERIFQDQLTKCGVDYFDVYLLHWLNEKNAEIAEKAGAFSFLRDLKEEGYAGRIGFSFHGTPETLDRLLTEHPEMDLIQLQINYLDWDSPAIQSRRCYETARRHGKELIVMEPVRGGALAVLPDEAEIIRKQRCPNENAAALALRFAQSLPGVAVVLSGMSTAEQVVQNMAIRDSLYPEELDLLEQIVEILRRETSIPCTGCRYCEPNCPLSIPIPDLFALYNECERMKGEEWKMDRTPEWVLKGRGRPADCLQCGQCEQNCPQHLPIPELMKTLSDRFH